MSKISLKFSGKAATMVCIFLMTMIRLLAVEGMWLPVRIGENIEEMQQMGLQLSAEDIYSDSMPSLKDAIVRFGRGCTGSFISQEGLLLTNHHCGYSVIQSHSTVENDYLQHGFWAGSREEELPNPGLTVTLLLRMEDVTARVLDALHEGMNEEQRNAAVRGVSAEISREATTDKTLSAQVVPFYYGNEYFLFVYRTYSDVRLVGAPPSYIGKYGGDTDNWMWPRHSADFALFRVYAGHDNLPADYHADNLPFRPAHYLPVANMTPPENAFTMVVGYPGSTNQYLTSEAVSFIKHKEYPMQIELRTRILDIYEDEMKKSDQVRIQYAAKHARVSNAWKRWKGEINGLRRLGAVSVKQEQEAAFNEWTGLTMGTTFDKLLDNFSLTYAMFHPYRLASQLYIESIRNIELLRFAGQLDRLVRASKEQSMTDNEIAALAAQIMESSRRHFQDYHPATDKRIAESMLGSYLSMASRKEINHIPEILQHRRMNDLPAFTERLFKRSMLSSEDETINFLQNYRRRDYKKIEKDPAYSLYMELESHQRDNIQNHMSRYRQQTDSLYRLYTAGLRQMHPGKKFFPDANATMRITYGRVEGSFPRDGLHYLPYCNTNGILEKAMQTNIDDYQIEERFEELLRNQLFGNYARNGELVVNFIASNHTTGGSSGSPVINRNGHLIGLNYDRSWESTMSDIMFDPDQCRNISVNAQYILWVIDLFAGKDYLLNEMSIVR